MTEFDAAARAKARELCEFKGWASPQVQDMARALQHALDALDAAETERDEARKEFAAAQGQADINYKRWCDAQARIAELEAQPSARATDLPQVTALETIKLAVQSWIDWTVKEWHDEGREPPSDAIIQPPTWPHLAQMRNWVGLFDSILDSSRTFPARPSAQFVDLVFENGPCPEGARFVEAEDAVGKSIRIGEWIAPKEGETYWRLRLPMPSSAQFVAGMREALRELLKAVDFVGSGVVDWHTWIEDASQQARVFLTAADKLADEPNASGFRIGDPVSKLNGYAFDGTVVAAFKTCSGAARYVVEHETIHGLLHIYSADQLAPRTSSP